jgi:hypothetical protein
MKRQIVTAGIALASCAIALSGQSPNSSAPRLHHVHLRVEDPAAAMDVYAKAHGCNKTIVQGLGVGVRCGTTYVLFDRSTEAPAFPSLRGRVTVTGSGDAAIVRAEIAVADGGSIETWMRDRLGFESSGALTFAPLAAGASLPDEVSHVAVGLTDPAPLISRLSAAGTRVLVRGPESTTFAGPSGLAIEVARDAGLGPDKYWCAMHPDVRSPNPGKCPICGMTLVAIPPPVFGDDRMEVIYKPTGTDRGRLTLRVVDPATSKLRTKFVTVHERPFHLFIVSRDLAYFDHVHPQVQKDGSLALDLALPGPGMYMLYGDFYPTGGTPQLLQASLVTPGYVGSPFPNPAGLQAEADVTKVVDGHRVTLTVPPLAAGREAVLTFDVSDARTGAPVTDLEPYLGAAGHVFMVSADLTDADHSHPTDFGTKGPRLSFHVRPPQTGNYKIWVQFQRAGKVVTVPFVVVVT